MVWHVDICSGVLPCAQVPSASWSDGFELSLELDMIKQGHRLWIRRFEEGGEARMPEYLLHLGHAVVLPLHVPRSRVPNPGLLARL